MAEARDVIDLSRDLVLEQAHVTYLFPEATNLTVTFTAGTANNWSEWVEITDGATTLSSKITTRTHLIALMIEKASVQDKVFMWEIARGDTKGIVSRGRFIDGTTPLLPPIQMVRVRSTSIPAGETIYYRMMCETGAATCQVSFRYHFHSGE